jgi:DNA-binding NtrC family response regulator
MPAANVSSEVANCVLSVSPLAADHVTLRNILEGLAWNVTSAANCRQAMEQLRRTRVSVILCESVLEDGTWKDILNHIAASAHAPLLIVTSRVADEYLWAEALNLGAFDVLAKPFRQQEVRHVLTTASLDLVHAAAPRVRNAAAG